jgi:hypothetical protein
MAEMLVDEFFPVYDVSDEVATVVVAEQTVTWEALDWTNPELLRHSG